MLTKDYCAPAIELSSLEQDEKEVVWWAPLAIVLAYWGGAWAWCVAVCWGPRNIKSCDVKWWGSVRAECR
jgi:hypothetical protein